MASKKTSDLIPFCHPIPLESCDITIELESNVLTIECETTSTHKTGVEMEAIVGCTGT
jgi:cyclic pyranopterin phosphate synthase